MARKKAEAFIKQRPFIMVYLDFLTSDILENCYQKIIYIYLKLFANANGECFPSIKRLAYLTKISINKVKSTLNELIQIGLVEKKHRTRPDGGTDSNLYTIHDSGETWGAESRPDGKRPFIKVYKDFLENNQLDNCFQKLVYICLGKFADARRECFPSIKKIAELAGIGISKVKSTLNELKQKGMIDKKNRWKRDGGKNSNLYTLLYDLKEKLNIGNSKKANDSIDDETVNEKELDSAPAKVQRQALKHQKVTNYTIPNPEVCQGAEKYTLEQIHEHFNYDIIINDNSTYKDDIDAVIDILYDTLNTTKPTVMIGGESKPTNVVIGRLMKLNEWSIMYAIEQFRKQDGQRIKNPQAYMRTILYNAASGGYSLDLENQVVYNEAHWHENPNNPNRKGE